jgi:hypothetical protein
MKFKGKINPFTKELLIALGNGTGCSVQYNNCPCNTCFHTWAEDVLELSPDFAHMFWLVVLALRGDSPGDSIIGYNKRFFQELANRKAGKIEKFNDELNNIMEKYGLKIGDLPAFPPKPPKGDGLNKLLKIIEKIGKSKKNKIKGKKYEHIK